VLRLSIDAKANVNLGPFARGGYNRCGIQASDHDFAPDMILKPFGIYLPALDENYFYFTDSKVTPDFMVDALEDLWTTIKVCCSSVEFILCARSCMRDGGIDPPRSACRGRPQITLCGMGQKPLS
jgi:DDE family transposase